MVATIPGYALQKITNAVKVEPVPLPKLLRLLERRLVDKSTDRPQIRFRDGINIWEPLLVFKVPEMQRFLVWLAQQCADAVNQLYGLQIFGFAGNGSGKHKPFGASLAERKAVI